MVSATAENESLYEAALRQAQVKHAVKTALGCCVATFLSFYFHVPTGQLSPVFAFLLMTLGMPSPRLNWLLTQLAIVASALVSAAILVAFWSAPPLYLAVTLAWVFTCVLFQNWLPLPATLGAMVSALGIFTFQQGDVGAALSFYVDYAHNFLIAGFSVVVVHTLLWELNTRRAFLERLAAVYAILEDYSRDAAGRVLSAQATSADSWAREWAPFRSLRQMVAPELRHARDTSNPFAHVILASRSLNLRLWFFSRVIAPLAPGALPPELRRQIASVLHRCADHLHVLLVGVLHRQAVAPIDPDLLREVDAGRFEASRAGADEATLLAHPIEQSILHRVIQSAQSLTTAHNSLLASLRAGLAGELISLRAFPAGRRLIDVNSVRSGTKLVLILLLLLGEEVGLRFPGGSQVAFFATFFASTGNLGRQNKTDVVGLAGLLGGFLFGVVAAFITSRLPEFPLLLGLVFLGQFLASLTYQRLPRYGVAGLQAGLALPFAYLSTTGAAWGSFSDVRTRFWGLVLAGFTAVVVHAYLWPVLPMRQLRASIAAALRDTAARLEALFTGPRSTWAGSPASLDDVATRARDLLDDARYLPGPDHADPAYNDIVACLQEIDANLAYIHFLLGLEEEHFLRQRFFQLIGDYAPQARTNLDRVAQQFQPYLDRAARVEPLRWVPDVTGRWVHASSDLPQIRDPKIDPWRPALIARCLDDIARAAVQTSRIAAGINLRSSSSRADRESVS